MTAALLWDHGIEGNDTQRVCVDHVFDAILAPCHPRVIGKSRAERTTLVVIASNQVVRHRQWRQQLAQVCVFVGLAEINQVTGDDNCIRLLLQRKNVRDTTTQALGGVNHAIGFLAMGLDMEIGDLGEEHDVIRINDRIREVDGRAR